MVRCRPWRSVVLVLADRYHGATDVFEDIAPAISQDAVNGARASGML